MSVTQAEKVRVEVDPGQACTAYARHRRRFAEEAAALDAGALTAPSRCSRWSVADVLRHCTDVDGWMQAIWTGQPLPFTAFDPVTTPDEFVAAGRAVPDEEVRDRYAVSAERMAADVERSGSERWGQPALSPLGFVPWWLSLAHVFWDSWVHERDALLPLGLDVPAHADEVTPVLSYSLAVAGTLITEPTHTVVAGVRLTPGDGTPATTRPDGATAAPAAVVDALAGRGRLDDVLPDTEPAILHRLGALARLFSS
jgi:uncharacterized protein (TIGR03083 family)